MNSEADFSAEARFTLKNALEELAFDAVLFFEHAPDSAPGSNLSCVRFVIDEHGNAGTWPQRWQLDLPGKAPWMRSDKPWVDDLETLLDDPVAGSTLHVGELVGIAQLRQRGVRSMLGAAVFDGDRIAVSIVLGSKQVAAYGAHQRDHVRRPEIAAAMQHLLDRLRQRRLDLVRTLQQMFKPDLPPEVVAGQLVENLANAAGWDFVGIYRVEDQFAMVAGCDRTPGQVMQIDPAYRQDLDVGMLGHTLRRRTCLWADDVTTVPPPFDFMKVDGFAAKSALSYPIIVSGNVEWILDCSSIATGAFNGPDRQMLDELIQGLQSTLNLWFETRLSNAILDSLSEAVVVTNRAGDIQRINAAACKLFGLCVRSLPRPLSDLAAEADVATRAKLQPSRPLTNDDVALLTANGQSRDMLVTARLSSEAFGRYVYKFSPKGEREWLAAIDIAQEAVQGRLGQARGMLMLASALTTRVRSQLRAPDGPARADGLLARVATAIDGADMTYDRLIGSMGSPPGKRGDVRAFESLVDWAIGALRSEVRTAGGDDSTAATAGRVGVQTIIDTLGMVAARLTPPGAAQPSAWTAARSDEQAP